ncbi:hypothetical protein [Komagataeibacter sp. FNDCF1]|uniref:hypothetical protein n=1 Tax=Komagataeibacter TaxID=1434011 RepID=UPI001E543D59|nr:hypothetical protein [Komagataeibacter sp. FNDCF1]MCE2564184.1 hypothetical protein [Komagataeibacter sp. FNDCF1]
MTKDQQAIEYVLRPEIDEDVMKVADFISSNVHPEKVHLVAKWVADISHLLWEKPKMEGKLLSRATPVSIIRCQ